MNIAIIGCGLIGEKRLNAFGKHSLLYAVDKDKRRAEKLCQIKGEGTALCSWEGILSDPKLDMVIVATTNDALSQVTIAALECNNHVLVEKPAGRNPGEIADAIRVQDKSNAQVKVGFNHRFHPALIKAKKILSSGELGELMFIRGRYGHGGRLGYEKEWRFDKTLAGGGELLDQGVHLIDLSGWMFGEDLRYASGAAATYFWDSELDDNGFMHLQTDKKQTAWLHVSATEWKNLFCMEIYGKHGKLQIDGLGGSYGVEKLTYYKMLPEMGPPETTSWEYPFPDRSWQLEFEYFLKCIEQGQIAEGNLYDAQKAIEIVHEIYGGTDK